MRSINLKIQGMTCASCAANIEKTLGQLDGVKYARVNFATEKGDFGFDEESQEVLIKDTIKGMGYSYVDPKLKNIEIPQKKSYFSKFLISILFSVAIFMLEMGPLKSWPTVKINWILQLILATPVWLWVGFHFQKAAFNFIRSGRSNMNTLIGIGTSAAYLYSLFITLFHESSIELGLTQKVYFEAVGFIIAFVFLGQYFEEKAKRKTKESLNSLLNLSSKKALRLVNGTVTEVEVDEISIGDVIRVKPGGKFPVDGLIVQGESSINESMLSGEPMPVYKSVGALIYAGTINGESVIDYKATRIGLDTLLSQIVAFVEKAQNSKPKIQRYADKISGIFTPVVILISILTFLSWLFFGPEPNWGNAISNFIAVLVIACPCALGLATPTAVVVATGIASLKGLLIAGGDVLEKAVGINAIVFDKTGTITEGKPSVIEFISKGNELDVLRATASIEQFSEHPISRAILQFARDKNLQLHEPEKFEVIKGKGLVARWNGDDYVIGKESFISERGISTDKDFVSEKIGTEVYVAVNGSLVALILVGDKVKPKAKEVISELKSYGIKTWMITGDNKEVAEQVSQELGIDDFFANVLPLEKAKHIEEIQAQGFKVAMIGDGVNDAPALAKADLSLAMGTGTDVAINASDVTIVKGDISKALDFIRLSNETMKIIKQNLFLSLIYNSLLIPVAAGLLYFFGGPMMPPILASVAMGLSSISVVSNSLRIKIR